MERTLLTVTVDYCLLYRRSWGKLHPRELISPPGIVLVPPRIDPKLEV